MVTLVLLLIAGELAWIGYWFARAVLTMTKPVGTYEGLPIWRATPYAALFLVTLILLSKLF